MSIQIDSEDKEEKEEEDQAPAIRSGHTVEEVVATATATAKRPKEIPSKENEILEENPWLSTFSFSSSAAATRPITVPSTATLESSLMQSNKWTKVESAKSKKNKAAHGVEDKSADVAIMNSKGRKNETANDKEVSKINGADTEKTKTAPGKEKSAKNTPSAEKSISAPDAEKAKSSATVRAPLLMQKSQVRSALVGLYSTV